MKLVDLATRRRVTIAMFTLAVLIFGTVSLSRLGINLLPDLAYPTLTIRTEYAGGAPVEIENLITKPIEEALGVVKNVERVRSVSRTGQSDVVLEFAWGTDMDYAGLDVREKLDALELPLGAARPVLLRFDPSFDPVLRFGLRGSPGSDSTAAGAPAARTIDEGEALKRLRRLADEQIKKELESTAGVAAVKISGGLEDEVQVMLDRDRLAQLGIPIERVVQVLRAENVNMSGGRLEQGVQQLLVRTVNEFETVDEIGDVVLEQREGRPILLRDVAAVGLGHREREAITRIDGAEAVEIALYKEGDANTVAVADAVEARMAFVRENLPEGVELVDVYNQATFISQAVDEVIHAGLIGGLLAVLVLYFFLRDFRTTVIIGLSIPASVVATFNLMYGFDLSLNIMSLGGLALGIGLLVDNSIVVLENVARHREMGKSIVDAARDGAGEVGQAVVASTLTTVAVFFPLVFVSGIAGQLFRDQALTVTFSLLASLVVALTLIPMLASIGRERREPRRWADIIARPRPASWSATRERLAGRSIAAKVGGWIAHVFDRFLYRIWFAFSALHFAIGWLLSRASRVLALVFGTLARPFGWATNRGYDAAVGRYPGVLRWALGHRGAVLGVAVALFAASVAIVPTLGLELIPQLAQGEFDVELRLPPGTPLETTDAVVERLQRRAAASEAVTMTFAVAGTGNRMDANPDEGGENWGEVHVASTADDEAEAMRLMREQARRVPGLEYHFARPSLFTLQTPIEVEIAGYDLDALRTTAADLAGRMADTDRFADVEASMQQGHPELQIHFDREKAAALGLSVYEIADRVVDEVRGAVATRYSWNDRKIDVLVRAREDDRAGVDDIRRLIVNPESPRPVPLSAVAEVVAATGPGEIRRSGQQRVAVVTANLARGDLGTATQELDGLIAATLVPRGVSIRQAGQGEEMGESFRSLLFALALAVFLVYLVMASQFESLVHPFVIFFSIPLAGIGAVLALWLTGTTLSIVVFIGLILLAGIVVNNAIVLVDLVNTLREQGMARNEALVEAGRLRLRPILMTTITTALGLLPLAVGLGEGAEIRAPMAITVIGGLLVSTALTLLVIPVLYSLLDRRPDAAVAASSMPTA